MEKIQEMELQETIVMPLAVASLAPSVLRPDPAAAAAVFEEARNYLKMNSRQFAAAIETAKQTIGELLELFELPDQKAIHILDDLIDIARADAEQHKETA